MRGCDTAQGASELKSQCDNPFPRLGFINPVDFNPFADHGKLDAELLHLCEHFTAKYEEILALRANILSMYDLVYD